MAKGFDGNVPEFPGEKLGEWIEVDDETYFMVTDRVDQLGRSEHCFEVERPFTHARGIMQVETEAGSVSLVETYVPIVLVMSWIGEEEEDESIAE